MSQDLETDPFLNSALQRFTCEWYYQLVNALAFTSSSYLFLRLSKDSIDAERKRHDLVIEQLQKSQIQWTHKRQEQIDFINKQLRLEQKAETKFTELNDAMRECH